LSDLSADAIGELEVELNKLTDELTRWQSKNSE